MCAFRRHLVVAILYYKAAKIDQKYASAITQHPATEPS